MTVGEGRSTGKVILSGEHSAVYGEPAIVCGVDLDVVVYLHENGVLDNVPKEYQPFFNHAVQLFFDQQHIPQKFFGIEWKNSLPIGAGLGSSAAIAHALFQALAKYFDRTFSKAEMVSLIQESERYAHGHPSGLDAVGVVYGGVMEFQRHGEELKYSSIETTALDEKDFFLIDSGKPVESTKEMIEQVRVLVQKNEKTQKVIQHMGIITKRIHENLKQNFFDPKMLTENQKCLEDLGVVSKKAKFMIEEMMEAGGYAKVTGAGGAKEGSGIILATHHNSVEFCSFLTKKKWQYYQVRLGVKKNDKG